MLNKERLIKKGKKYYFRDMYEKAIDVFNKLDIDDSYFCLGLIYSEKGNLRKAIHNFEKCLEVHKEKYKNNFEGELIPVLEELLPLYWQDYLHSSDKRQKENLKESFKKRVEELRKINDLNMNPYRFSAISLEEENKKKSLEMWKRTYESSMYIQYKMSFGTEKPNTILCSEVGFNFNKFIERIAALKIMDLSEDKKEALEYLFNPFRISHTKEFKREEAKGLFLENILTSIEQDFLEVYNKNVCSEVKSIEDMFFKTGSVDALISKIRSSQNYSKNPDLQLALGLAHYFKGKYGMSSKIMKSALNNIIKQKNEEIKNVDVKSKNEVREYSHTFDSFRIFPKIDFIFKRYTKQESDIIQYYRKISHKRHLAFNLPQIVDSLNIGRDKWGVMLYEVKENAFDYLNNHHDSKKKSEIISKIITILAELHAHAPKYDSGLFSLLHTSNFHKNKLFYKNQISQRFFKNLEKIITPYNQNLEKQISQLTIDDNRIKKKRDVVMLSNSLEYCETILKKVESREQIIQEDNNFLYLPSKGILTFLPLDSSTHEAFIKKTYQEEKVILKRLLEEKIKNYTNTEKQHIKKFKKVVQSQKIKVADLEQKFFKYYSSVIDIISSCPQGVYKDAFLRNFLTFEAGCYTPIGIIDFETFSNLPYQMDLATLFEFGVITNEAEHYDRRTLLEVYIKEFNSQIGKHKLRRDKIRDTNKFEKEYYACALHRNLTLFGSFIQVGEKKEYLIDCLSNSITNAYHLLGYINKKDNKKLNDLIKELQFIQERIKTI